ncbi:DUF2283 domain-containing protein [Mycobacterium gordonae]|nr:DUF2283 domain-containing protein [Mycobacterium sp.]MCV7010659.1 DUF2283 domain-containing protein [Mycobacterium gordonae]
MVTLRVDSNVRAAYIQFTDAPIVETIELTPHVLVDIDETDTVVGVELLSLNAAIPVDAIEHAYHFAAPEHRQILMQFRLSTRAPLSYTGSGQSHIPELQSA